MPDRPTRDEPPSLFPPTTSTDALLARVFVALIFAAGCSALACGGVARVLGSADGTTWLVAIGAGLCVLPPVWIVAIAVLRRATRA